MTAESMVKEENQLVVIPESSKSLHFANSWNCTEVFLTDVVYGAMKRLDDVRCDSDNFCLKVRREGNGETLEILNDLKSSESRQEPPAPSEDEHQGLTPASSIIIHNKYSMDSLNSILVDDSFDDANDCETLEEEEEESLVSGKTKKIANKDTGASRSANSSEGSPVEDGQVQNSTTTIAQHYDALYKTSTPAPLNRDETEKSNDSLEVEETEVLANFLKAEREIEDILRVNGEIKYEDVVTLIDKQEIPPAKEEMTYEDVVSLIENSFLPSEAVAKAVHGIDNPYFDDNAMEQRVGEEKFRCSLLPFFC